MKGKLHRFEDIDVLHLLGEIVKRHVKHYMNDFDIDVDLIRTLAENTLPECPPEEWSILWMARPAGTWCFRERNVYLRDSFEYNSWKFYGEQTHDRILAYALELKGTDNNGDVIGTVHELDYTEHTARIKSLALPIAHEMFIFDDGTVCAGDDLSYRITSQRLQEKYGRRPTVEFVQKPESDSELAMILKNERVIRDRYSTPGDIDEHIRAVFREDFLRPSIKLRLDKNKSAADIVPSPAKPSKSGPER
jgi:hypothetical protein